MVKRYRAEVVSEVITSIQTYVESNDVAKTLVLPTALLFAADSNAANADEVSRIVASFESVLSSLKLLDAALAALKILDASDFAETTESWPQPYTTYPGFETPSFDLPSILVPPEVIELDGLATDSGEDAHIQKEEWPQFRLRLFEDAVSSAKSCEGQG